MLLIHDMLVVTKIDVKAVSDNLNNPPLVPEISKKICKK